MNGPLLLRCLGDGHVLRNAGLRSPDDPQRYLEYYRNLLEPSTRPSNDDDVTATST